MNVILEQRFREKLQLAIDANRWTQADLARAMEVDRQYVSKYFKGHANPGLDVIERFAKALHVEPLNLLDENEIRILSEV
jgi:hypothetical protein